MEQEFKISQEIRKSFLISASACCIFFIGFVILGIYAWQDPTSTSFNKYIFFPWFTFSTLYRMLTEFYKGSFMRILVNKDQIKFESFGVTITSDWSKLITIEDKGISVRRSSIRKSPLGLLEMRPQHIPIQYFGANWQQNKLGKQIKQYAPHLFETENKQSA